MKRGRLALAVRRKKISRVKWKIIEDFCKGCNFCIEFCPVEALSKSQTLNKKGIYLPKITDEDKCIGCGLCVTLCPDFAIYLEKVEDNGEKNDEVK